MIMVAFQIVVKSSAEISRILYTYKKNKLYLRSWIFFFYLCLTAFNSTQLIFNYVESGPIKVVSFHAGPRGLTPNKQQRQEKKLLLLIGRNLEQDHRWLCYQNRFLFQTAAD